MAAPLIAKELQAAFRARSPRPSAAPRVPDARAPAARPARGPARRAKSSRPVAPNVEAPAAALETSSTRRSSGCPRASSAEPQQTLGVERVLQRAAIHVLSAEQKVIDGGDVLVAHVPRGRESHARLPARARRASPGSTSSTTSRTASPRAPRTASGDGGRRAPGGVDEEDGEARPRTRSRPTRPTSTRRPRKGASTR